MMKPLSLRIHLGTAFTLLVLLVGGLIGWTAQKKTVRILNESMAGMTDAISGRIGAEITYREARVRALLRLLARTPGMFAAAPEERMASLGLFREVLDQMPAAASVFMGYGNGDYFSLGHFTKAADSQLFAPPEATAYVVQSIERGKGEFFCLYLDRDMRELARSPHPRSLAFDLRTRPWYVAAQGTSDVAATAPYTFFISKRMGTTLTMAHGGAVLGIDLYLDDFSAVLDELKPTPGSCLGLVSGANTLLATDDPGFRYGCPVPGVFAFLLADRDQFQAQKCRHVSYANEDWQASLLRVSGIGRHGFYLALMVPEREMLGHALELLHEQAAIVLVLLTAGLAMGLWFARRLSRELISLSAAADRVRHFDFSQSDPDRFLVLEVENLSRSMEQMRHTIARFLDITARVAGEENLEHMLPVLLRDTMETAAAQAGVLYLNDREEEHLGPVAAQVEDQAVDAAALTGMALETAPLGMARALEEGHPVTGQVSGSELTAETGLRFQVKKAQILAVPLMNREGVRLGVLLLCSHDAFDRARSRFIEYLSGYASVSLETRELIQAQKNLFDAFVRLIAHAIDAKSPYTGAHCMRVPELTRMLAEAACAETQGPLADFNLDDDGWEAVNLAAWLHDCGKVTTPEFVVDKATRLETRNDRIHEIRTRFEVMKREKEAACWKAIAKGADEKEALADLQRECQALDEDFYFVAECNNGDLFISDERRERLEIIAQRRWTRTLSDRLGLGPQEAARKAGLPEPALPVADPLLSDRPDHRIPHPHPVNYPEELGITLRPLEWLYDHGELKNLTTPRGTLTAEERFKISEHIIQTYIMLKQLPFPFHLQQVPEMAAGHHERVDGKGYPRGLKGSELHVVARMLAVADIFEAMTAFDRPYKAPQTPEAALKIMRNMAAEGHIDPDLMELFERSGIVERYMARHPAPRE